MMLERAVTEVSVGKESEVGIELGPELMIGVVRVAEANSSADESGVEWIGAGIEQVELCGCGLWE